MSDKHLTGAQPQSTTAPDAGTSRAAIVFRGGKAEEDLPPDVQAQIQRSREMTSAFGFESVDLYLSVESFKAKVPDIRGRADNVFAVENELFVAIRPAQERQRSVRINMNAIVAARLYEPPKTGPLRTPVQRDSIVARDKMFSALAGERCDIYLDVASVQFRRPTVSGMRPNGMPMHGSTLARFHSEEEPFEFWLFNLNRVVMIEEQKKGGQR